MLGHNAPEDRLVARRFSTGTTRPRSTPAYKQLTDALRPWTIDFHVAQNNGEVFGSGSHDKTGRHCLPNAPDGKLDIVKYAGYWLRDESGKPTKRFNHICWDGCMFPNEVLMKPRHVERHPGDDGRRPRRARLELRVINHEDTENTEESECNANVIALAFRNDNFNVIHAFVFSVLSVSLW